MGNQLADARLDARQGLVSAHEHPLAPKRTDGLQLLSRSPWKCDGCQRRSLLNPTMRRFSCVAGCHFDLCGRCFKRESGSADIEEDEDDEDVLVASLSPNLSRAQSGQSIVSSRLPPNATDAEIFSVVSVSADHVDVLRRASDTSMEQAECAICYDHLCNGPVAVLNRREGGRSCSHFFHAACLRRFSQSGIRLVCPLCRTEFSEIKSIPPPAVDPEGWFRAMDANQMGVLTRQEVYEALRAVFPVNKDALEKHFDVLWACWDKTSSGDITMEEFLNPDGGLLSWVIETGKEVQRRAVDPPDIMLDREGWFKYWDTDHAGTLDKEQLMRAFLKTFRDADVMQLRGVVGALWADFEGSKDTIGFEEFVRPNDGFLDVILTNIKVEGEPLSPQQEHQGSPYAVGVPCSCGKVHVRRGDRVQRGPRWMSGDEDGGVGEYGTVIRDEENSGMVFVQWDLSPTGATHGYSWPADPSGHEVEHVRFDAIPEHVMQLQMQVGLSSVATTELVRRTAIENRREGGDVYANAVHAFTERQNTTSPFIEEDLRQPLKLFDRCRVLPDTALVRQWFDACPPCPCTNPGCTGGVRWNPNAEKHLGREGYVLKIDPRDDTVFVEVVGRCNCKLWYPRLAVDRVLDPDVSVAPRFQVGNRVECKMDSEGEVWASGVVSRIWWRQEGFGNRRTAPYQIRLDDGRMISAPQDHDNVIRAASSS